MKIIKRIDNFNIVRIKAGISNSARLPLSVCRGTASERNNLSRNYCNELKKELDKHSRNNSCETDVFKKAINNVLNNQYIKFDIKPIEASNKPYASGAIGRNSTNKSRYTTSSGITTQNIKSDIDSYSFFLPLSYDNKTIKNKYTALHEAQHFFDYICNPKTINFRSYKMLYEPKRTEAYKKVYDSFVEEYNPLRSFKRFKKETKKALNNMSAEDAIDTLQTARNAMKSEQNAYLAGRNYLKTKPIRNIIHNFLHWKYLKVMHYDQKIKFAEEMLAEKLKEARSNIKENLHN